MKRNKEITKKRLFISELERPAPAATATTQAVGEESGKWFCVTTLALGEEAVKTK